MVRFASLTFAALFVLACFAAGCQVPVFRYALERWAPADYLVRIAPSPSGLSEAEKTIVESLRGARSDAETSANVELEIAAGAERSELALLYPGKPREAARAPVWQAPLTAESVRGLLDSPARQELRKRLLAGESAVWVLVESGDRAKDDAAFSALNDALGEAAASLKLPDGVVTPSQSTGRANENAEVLRTDLPLRIAFSTMRVRRDDAREAVLLAMLTHVEDDLATYAAEPMAFPVFGRGRVLEPLIGRGIHKANVIEHATYLCGACSCEVKDQNPGIDLLIAANWAPVDTTPKVEIIRIAPGTPAPAAVEKTLQFRGIPIAAAALGLAAVLVAWLRRGAPGR